MAKQRDESPSPEPRRHRAARRLTNPLRNPRTLSQGSQPLPNRRHLEARRNRSVSVATARASLASSTNSSPNAGKDNNINNSSSNVSPYRHAASAVRKPSTTVRSASLSRGSSLKRKAYDRGGTTGFGPVALKQNVAMRPRSTSAGPSAPISRGGPPDLGFTPLSNQAADTLRHINSVRCSTPPLGTTGRNSRPLSPPRTPQSRGTRSSSEHVARDNRQLPDPISMSVYGRNDIQRGRKGIQDALQNDETWLNDPRNTARTPWPGMWLDGKIKAGELCVMEYDQGGGQKKYKISSTSRTTVNGVGRVAHGSLKVTPKRMKESEVDAEDAEVSTPDSLGSPVIRKKAGRRALRPGDGDTGSGLFVPDAGATLVAASVGVAAGLPTPESLNRGSDSTDNGVNVAVHPTVADNGNVITDEDDSSNSRSRTISLSEYIERIANVPR